MNNQSNSFPTVPSSLSTGDYGMRGDYAAQGAPGGVYRTAQHSLEDIRPYLGLRSRLSQVWINRWTILILLILARVLIAIGSLRTDMDQAKGLALSACTSVESIGSNMASMPHYLAGGVNSMAAHGIEKAIVALYHVLFDIISAAEEMFVFWVNMLYGVYECLITFAVTGALHGVLQFADDATKALNQSLGTIGDDISKGLSDFNSKLQSFEGAFNDVASAFSGKQSPPATIDLSSEIKALKNLQIPSGVTTDIQKLNSSIPNFDEVKNFTDNVLRLPFEEIKKLMNESLPIYQFNKSLLPVPPRTQLTFCNDNNSINDFFAKLYDLADTARKIFIVVLLIAALLACIPMGYMEIRRWRSQKAYASRMQDYAVDNIDGVYIASRPWTSWGGIKVSQRFGSARAQLLARWFVAYITSIPALVLLSFAIAGLLSSLCQYLILKSIAHEVPELADDIGKFADKVVASLTNASQAWANGTNHIINQTNTDINQKVFGWVNTSTHAVNDTLNTFVNKTIGVLNGTFGGTVLYEPILEVYNCLIGMKVAGIEKGLTWVSDHAYIELPELPADIFSDGAANSLVNQTTASGHNNNFLADPSDSATDKVTEVVSQMVQKVYDGIRTEALLSVTLLVLYLVLVMMGLARVVYSLTRGGSRSRAEGGPSYAGDVPPGAAEDNTNQAAIANHHESFVASTPAHLNPPPVYTPPRKTKPRWPFSHESEVQENDEQSTNEKAGSNEDFDGHTMVSCDYGQEQNEKRAFH